MKLQRKIFAFTHYWKNRGKKGSRIRIYEFHLFSLSVSRQKLSTMCSWAFFIGLFNFELVFILEFHE